MAKEKTEEISQQNEEILPDEKQIENDEVLKLAFEKANEKKIPIILWQKKDEKEFLFQIISYQPNSNIVNAFWIQTKGKKIEVQFQIKPSALNSQLMKFGIHENDIFAINYLGEKPSPNNPEFKFKSFIVRKYDIPTKLFFTTKMLE